MGNYVHIIKIKIGTIRIKYTERKKRFCSYEKISYNCNGLFGSKRNKINK